MHTKTIQEGEPVYKKRLRNGQLVAAKYVIGEGVFALTYANRTGAEKKQAEMTRQGFVCHVRAIGPPFYVMIDDYPPTSAQRL